MKPLGIAMVGSGMISGFHLRALREISEFEIRGIWGIDVTRTKEIAEEFGICAYESYEAMLTDSSVQVVDICLPSGLHADFGIQAARAGKHVIVEKPIDITLEKALQLQKECTQNGVFLAVISQYRYFPAAQKIKHALDNQLLGKLIAAEATVKWYRDEKYYQSSSWKGTKALDGGGAVINQSIHYIDKLLWYMGNYHSVTSLVRTARHDIEVEDLAMALVVFENGAIGTITAATALKPGFPERIEIYGEKGAVALEAGRIVRWKVDGCDEAEYLDPVQTSSANADPAAISYTTHQAQLTEVAQAILAGKQPPVSGEEAIRALNLVIDIYNSNEKWLVK